MKRMNKNIGMKQRVRVLETGLLGTVTDQQLMKRNGEVHRYLQVRLDDQPHLDIWFWDDKLAGTKETCRVTLEDGESTYTLDITLNHDTDTYTILTRSKRNNNRSHIHDMSLDLIKHMLKGIGCTREDLENARPVE